MSNPFHYRYAALTAAEARDEAMVQIRKAAHSGKWDDLPERLMALRQVMSYAAVPRFEEVKRGSAEA